MDERVIPLPVDRIVPGRFQPRTQFEEAALEELAESLRRHGVVQPVVVRPVADGYELIAGERRWRAAQRARLATIPAIVRHCSHQEALELALIENLQREEIGPLDAARAFQRLIDEFGYTAARIAERTGKSRSTVANSLRLLRLPPTVQRQLESGALTEGHARALLGVDDPRLQEELAEYAVRNGLSVRELERRVRTWQRRARPRHTAPPDPSQPLIADLEDRLRRRLGTRVSLTYRQGRGTLTLEFYSDDDLERLLALLLPDPSSE